MRYGGPDIIPLDLSGPFYPEPWVQEELVSKVLPVRFAPHYFAVFESSPDDLNTPTFVSNWEDLPPTLIVLTMMLGGGASFPGMPVFLSADYRELFHLVCVIPHASRLPIVWDPYFALYVIYRILKRSYIDRHCFGILGLSPEDIDNYDWSLTIESLTPQYSRKLSFDTDRSILDYSQPDDVSKISSPMKSTIPSPAGVFDYLVVSLGEAKLLREFLPIRSEFSTPSQDLVFNPLFTRLAFRNSMETSRTQIIPLIADPDAVVYSKYYTSEGYKIPQPIVDVILSYRHSVLNVGDQLSMSSLFATDLGDHDVCLTIARAFEGYTHPVDCSFRYRGVRHHVLDIDCVRMVIDVFHSQLQATGLD